MANKKMTVTKVAEIEQAAMVTQWCLSAILSKNKTAYVTITDEEPEEIRSSKDNAQFHAIMSDIWKQGRRIIIDEYGDEKELVLAHYSFEACKTLLLVWFIAELKNLGEKIPAYMRINTFIDPLTSKVYNERASTTKYSAKMCRLLNQFLWSTGIDDFNVKFTEPAHKEYEKYREANQ